MDIENFFDFFDKDDIRIRGTRVGIETVLDDFLGGSSPEEIAIRYRSLKLEQVYATITYYLCNRQSVGDYLERWRQYSDQSAAEQDRNPSEVIKRLKQLKATKSESRYREYNSLPA